MPTYEFKNKKTGEVTEKVLRISEKQAFLEENPDLEPYFSTVNLGDPVRLGVTTMGNTTGFKHVLQQIHQRTAGSQLNKTTNI